MSRTGKPLADDKSMFGFWLYLLSDLMLFATFFAAFLVLRNSTFGGPGAEEIFSLPYVYAQTIILLTSSFTCGLAVISARNKDSRNTILWLVVTLLLGSVFLLMEINEFSKLVNEGFSWKNSAYLSGYFALVGLHGLHILAGLIWGISLIINIASRGLATLENKGVQLFSMFWHFLDIVWIFIFTIVYLIGRIGI